MDFNQFKSEFLLKLKSKDKNCLELIENNKQLIEDNFGSNGNPQIITEFVKEINDIIIDDVHCINIIINNSNSSLNNNYELLEKVLNHSSFERVLKEFKNSDVLIRACKEGHKSAASWLLTMNVSPYIQDENGRSAMMYAAQQNMDFVISPFFDDQLCMNIEDNNGENLLFYSLRNSTKTKAVEDVFLHNLVFNSEIDINHINHNSESILIYCIKNDIKEPINKYLISNPKVDLNVADNEGKTAAMYLTEKGYFDELYKLSERDYYFDYMNIKGESVMSILMSKIYSGNLKLIDRATYLKILNLFLNFQYNFNYPVDDDENTPFMIMLIVNDITTAEFCSNGLKELDLSVKNKYGENATSLAYKLNRQEILNLPSFKKNITFNYSYRDPINENTLLMISAINHNVQGMEELLENDPGIINEVNNKNENVLIISSKINNIEAVESLLRHGIDINHQDIFGNTALHYAVEIRSPYLIQKLIKKKSNIHLKNNEGKSPLDLAHEITENQQEILEILQNPSYTINKNDFGNPVDSKYENEMKSYVIPCANNNYPEFEMTNAIQRIANKNYVTKKNSDGTIFKQTVVVTLVIIIVSIFMLFASY